MILWKGDQALFTNLNNNEIGMKFTYQIHSTTIIFLDLKITLDDDGSVVTNIYRKATAANSFLKATAFTIILWYMDTQKKILHKAYARAT